MLHICITFHPRIIYLWWFQRLISIPAIESEAGAGVVSGAGAGEPPRPLYDISIKFKKGNSLLVVP
jgi:hypothetical protein